MARKSLVVAVVIALAVAALVYWRSHDPPVPAGAGSPASTATSSPPAHVRRVDPAQRKQFAAQIAAARAQARARTQAASTPSSSTTATGNPAPALADDTITLEQVSGSVKSALAEAIPILADCYHGETGKTAAVQMVLYSDPSIGTVIDTPAMTDGDGAPLSRELDDCLRTAIEALELPPLEVGGHLPLQYSFRF